MILAVYNVVDPDLPDPSLAEVEVVQDDDTLDSVVLKRRITVACICREDPRSSKGPDSCCKAETAISNGEQTVVTRSHNQAS